MKPKITQLSTKDLATLCERLIKIAQQQKYQELLQGNPLLQQLKERYASYEQTYSRNTFSGKGKEVAEADQKRDELFIGIRTYLAGHLKLKSLSQYQNAYDLYEIFKTHGLRLHEMSYSSESAQLKQLIDALSQQENLAKLEAMGISSQFEQLKQAQAEFEQIFAQQVAENAQLRQTKSASQQRNDLEVILRAYLNLLSAMQDVPSWQNLYLDTYEVVKAAEGS